MAHNLPNLVKPTHYDVTLYNFDFDKFTFSGDVTITYESLRPQLPLPPMLSLVKLVLTLVVFKS